MKKLIYTFLHKLHLSIKHYNQNDMFYLFGRGCFELFPPAFYYKHTQQEINEITDYTIKEIKNLLDEME